MPQAIIGYIASALAVSAAVATVIYYVATLAVTYAVGQYQSSKAKRKARDAYNASLQDRLVMTATTDGARSRVYGRVRNVDGIIFKGTHGPNNQFYTLVVAVAGHEVDAIEKVYFNDVPCTLDAEGYVQEAPYARLDSKAVTVETVASGTGAATATATIPPVAGTSVTAFYDTPDGPTSSEGTIVGSTLSASTYPGKTVRFQYQGQVLTRFARVWTYRGTDDQDIAQDILASRFPDVAVGSDRFAGIACVVVEFLYSPDAFPGGIPGVSAVMRGARVLDPRTGVTQWTESPALIARDWALYAYGGGCQVSEVRNASVIAAANACDVSTVFNTESGPSPAMPLYTCGVVCKLDTSPDVMMDEIVESMAGKWGWPGGELTMVAGVSRAPVATITEDWVTSAEDIVIVPQPPRSEVVNVYRPTISNKGKYPSAANDAEKAVVYTVGPAPDVRSDVFIEADGQEFAREIELGGVTDVIHAQHVCSVLMREARDGLTLKLPCNLRAYPLELFDVVLVTLPRFGFNAKLFEVIDWEFSMQNAVVLTLKETAASIYDPNSGLSNLDAAPNTELQRPWFVEAITGLTLASGTEHLLLQADGTVTSRILASWDHAQTAAVTNGGMIEVNWGRADAPSDTWETISVPGADTQVYLTNVADGAPYMVRVRAKSLLQVRSLWSEQVWTFVVGKTAPPANVTGLARVVVNSGVRITWNEATEVDYATTELRVGTSWASSSLLFSGKATSYTWLSPAVGTYTVWAKHYDTSANESVTAASVGVTVTATDAVNWTSIVGRPKQFRVVSRGFSDTQSPVGCGLYDAETGAALYGAGPMYTVVRIRRSDGAVTFQAVYDTLAGGSAMLNMASALNATGPDSIVVVYAYDEPQTNRLNASLLAAMKRCGASMAVYGSPDFKVRSSYILVGIGGCGEGQGCEVYSGSIDNDTNAWCEVAFQVLNGQLYVSGTGGTPRTLRDYSYTGDLNATSDIRLLGRGGAVVTGNTVTKESGTTGWNADCYSVDGFTGGAFASAVVNNVETLFGLTTDPLSSVSYDTIDWALYTSADGNIYSFENGIGTNLGVGWAVNDLLAVTYDGRSIRYYKNGTNIRTVVFAITLPLYFDSAFSAVGHKLSGIRFGPLTSIKEPMDAAATAAAAASAAQSAANAANAELSNIASDSVLSKGEKPAVIIEWDAIFAESTDIVAKAAAQGLSSAAYTTARLALSTYLASLSPAWNDTTQNTPIVGATFRARFTDLYAARQTLLNLIAVTIANGAVGTPQLGTDAATTTMTGESASGSTTVYSPTYTTVASVSWVNTTGAPVVIQGEWSVDLRSSSATFDASVIYTLDIPAGTSAGWISFAGEVETNLGKIIQRAVPAGGTVTVSMQIVAPYHPTSLPSGGTAFWKYAVVRLTAIKR